MEFEFKGIQKELHDWIGLHESGYWGTYVNLTHLMEEVGEVAREINHLYSHKKKKDDEKESTLGKELVDVIFSIVCIANSHLINLLEEWQEMFATKMNGMEFEDIQKEIDDCIGQHEPGYWGPYINLTHLMVELGDVAREINHLYSPKKKKEDEKKSTLGKKLIAGIVSIVCISNSHSINLSKEWQEMFATKLNGRDKQRFKKKVN